MKFYTRIALWLLLLVMSAWVALHIPVVADLTAFLPPTATRSQQLLVALLRNGVASRLILVAVEGRDSRAQADASRAIAERLHASGLFSSVNNGDAAFSSADRKLLLRYRYLLSPAVNADLFSASGLREALQSDLQLLASPVGVLIKDHLAADPTGELLRILTPFSSGSQPAPRYGVWFSRDGSRALLVAETKAPGFEVNKQSQASEVIRRAYQEAHPQADMHLLLTGPGVFAAESRAIIERDSWRLSLIAAALVLAILFSVYRSAQVVALGMLPVISGLLAGIAVVGLAFGAVHGITLGFAATLIGEAVDYPSYLFNNVAKGEAVDDALRRIWPTLRLAVLTTVFGGLTMLLSSFTGLSQLGLLYMTGVLAAGLVTRWVLPVLTPEDFSPWKAKPVDWMRFIRGSRGAAWLVWAALLLACGFLAARHDNLWDDDLANLNPISESSKKLDKALRAELGAPDVRHLVVMLGKDREQALERSEDVANKLHALVERKIIAGFDNAAQYLPSQKTQRARKAALPDATTLQKNIDEAQRGLPFRAGLFAPFLRDVEQARSGKFLDESELQGTALGLKVQSLLFQNGGEWVALLPLRGVQDEAQLAAGFAPSASTEVFLVDLKAESNRMINGYRNESLRLTGLGMLAITLVLTWGLRNARAVWEVIKPVLVALVITVALLLLLGERLNLFHLVSALLVLGIGLNYALFFNRQIWDEEERSRTHLSLMVCSLTTLSAFGCLAFSQTPVLHAIGLTVSLGALLSLLVSAVQAKQ